VIVLFGAVASRSLAATLPTSVPPTAFSSTAIRAELLIDGVLSLTSFRLIVSGWVSNRVPSLALTSSM